MKRKILFQLLLCGFLIGVLCFVLYIKYISNYVFVNNGLICHELCLSIPHGFVVGVNGEQYRNDIDISIYEAFCTSKTSFINNGNSNGKASEYTVKSSEKVSIVLPRSSFMWGKNLLDQNIEFVLENEGQDEKTITFSRWYKFHLTIIMGLRIETIQEGIALRPSGDVE
jgi:hypothetical protein